MNWRRFLIFAGKVVVAHVVTYFVVGAIIYPLITKPFYIGSDAVFSTFMRTEAEPDLWSHVMAWLIPGQILRGLLMAAVLYPFFDTLKGWDRRKRLFSIAGLYVVLGYWVSSSPAPGNIEGMIYMRPEIARYGLAVQPEIIVQGLALGKWVAWWMAPKPRQEAPETT